MSAVERLNAALVGRYRIERYLGEGRSQGVSVPLPFPPR